ncbi:4-hydroxythreonine-4-phosphate dehydrogenase PdxA [Aureimonas glaciei]|uniref:4-hydroxythreonine-4-phosphate dehydrogenase 1 n=1 Tax=Aureimonas glaciei TaxID=1776957 RepID=A0A917DDH7_9HYPH|nr:4-hydroxythreonine-4-phosphate dehydrogenase PdxA [Aureimonas glaciei]GGD29394.1 4-hydroxythreonine-4-phosphate dehydrogenase 1 [Aureimonas glaciei]
MTPTLAITIGDPAGIGPEIALKAVRALQPRLDAGEFRLRLVACPAILQRIGGMLGLAVPELTPEDDPQPAVGIWAIGGDPGAVTIGEVSAEGGRQAYDAIAEAVRLAMAGKAAAIVTAPLAKESLHIAGHHFAGHTELLAKLTGARDSVMMLAHGDFRVSHVTTHIALEDVPKRATPERMRRVLDLTLAALRDLGLADPRVAFAALNPHAGEGGIFGRHDIDLTAPVVADYVSRGEKVYGPIPGDTVFVKMKAGNYDCVIAMYHDQGHIPVKLLGFQVDPATGAWLALSGVNITLGLPIIRTSVDHGTAFDIAGQGIAHESSLIEAIDYALTLALTRR